MPRDLFDQDAAPTDAPRSSGSRAARSSGSRRETPAGPDATPAAPSRLARLAAAYSTNARRGALLGGLVVVAALVTLIAAWRGRGEHKPEPPPLPPGAVPVDVWAPYWTLDGTVPEAAARLAGVREVSPFWFGARGIDSIVVDEHSDAGLADELFDAIGHSPAALVPSVRDETEAGEMAAILADPGSRAVHVATLVEFADDLDAAGLDLDYEQFAFADDRATWATTRPAWVTFVGELADALHADGRTLTVSIPPVYAAGQTEATGYWVYDHAAIAPLVDSIRIMAYDYSVPEPGPIAPLAWVRRVVAGVSAAVPAEHHRKLVLGVPAYGSNWVTGATGECPATAEGRTTVTVRTATDLAARRAGTPRYDATAGEWTFDYDLLVEDPADPQAACVQSREVWWVGAEGVAERAEIGRRAGWGGVALWALGYEDQAAWDALVTAAQAPMPATPGTTTP